MREKLKEGWGNIKANFRIRPWRVGVGIIAVIAWKLIVFWFHVMLAAGLCAMVLLYAVPLAMPAMGFELIPAEMLDRMRTMSALVGFTVIFGALAIRVVARLTLGERPPRVKRKLWFLLPPVPDIGKEERNGN